jgi:hypothetical protein
LTGLSQLLSRFIIIQVRVAERLTTYPEKLGYSWLKVGPPMLLLLKQLRRNSPIFEVFSRKKLFIFFYFFILYKYFFAD